MHMFLPIPISWPVELQLASKVGYDLRSPRRSKRNEPGGARLWVFLIGQPGYFHAEPNYTLRTWGASLCIPWQW